MASLNDGGSELVDVKPNSALNEYHVELIHEGIRQAEAGELIDHSEVERLVGQLQSRVPSQGNASQP